MRTGAAVKPIRPATATWSLLAVVVCSLFLPGQVSVLGMPPPPQPSGRNRSPPVVPKPFGFGRREYRPSNRKGKAWQKPCVCSPGQSHVVETCDCPECSANHELLAPRVPHPDDRVAQRRPDDRVSCSGQSMGRMRISTPVEASDVRMLSMVSTFSGTTARRL
jgi:hypothetical protein